MTRDEWHQIAFRRLNNVLGAHTVANSRTLENKISDAGPNNQRVQPHILTEARQILEKRGEIQRIEQAAVWYHLATTPRDEVESRLTEQLAIHDKLVHHAFTTRLGQALEIAVYRALLEADLDFLGGYTDLESHDDSTLYHKEEPPTLFKGKQIPDGKRLDFVIMSNSGRAGVETKNIREWLYPHSLEIKDLLLKCCAIDAVPVLVTRRLPYITPRLLNAAGVVVHEMYNQIFPASDADLADSARNKNLLGYHDIRVGNEPDSRLLRFFKSTLPKQLPLARERFVASFDLLNAYSSDEISYGEFSGHLTKLVHKKDS